jgi:hypothetical protein
MSNDINFQKRRICKFKEDVVKINAGCKME